MAEATIKKGICPKADALFPIQTEYDDYFVSSGFVAGVATELNLAPPWLQLVLAAAPWQLVFEAAAALVVQAVLVAALPPLVVVVVELPPTAVLLAQQPWPALTDFAPVQCEGVCADACEAIINPPIIRPQTIKNLDTIFISIFIFGVETCFLKPKPKTNIRIFQHNAFFRIFTFQSMSILRI